MKSLRKWLVATSMLVIAASALSAQAGQVVCKDGTKSAGGRGACSGHGGIVSAMAKSAAKADAKMDKAEVRAAKAEKKADVKADAKMDKAEVKTTAKTSRAEKKADRMARKTSMEDRDARGATAECKDHTYSHAKTHQGSCSTHGGVAKFLDGK